MSLSRQGRSSLGFTASPLYSPGSAAILWRLP